MLLDVHAETILDYFLKLIARRITALNLLEIRRFLQEVGESLMDSSGANVNIVCNFHLVGMRRHSRKWRRSSGHPFPPAISAHHPPENLGTPLRRRRRRPRRRPGAGEG